VIPSLGARLTRIEPERFEAGATFIVFGEDIGSPDMEVVLGDVTLTVTERHVDRVVATAEGSPGTPIGSGTTLSAGELPVVVRRRLAGGRARASNLLAARLLPTVMGAAFVAGDLQLQGRLLGADADDVIVLFYRDSDGTTVRMFDTVTSAPDQQTLTVVGAQAAVPAGSYRVILRVNDQQAKASPRVVVP